MREFSRSETIDRPRDEVFAFATDLGKMTAWNPSIDKLEFETEGGMRPGARFRETRRMKGREMSAVIECVDHDPPRTHAAQSSMMGVTARYTYTFTPVDDRRTRVDLHATVRGRLLGRLFVGMAFRTMEREDGEQLARLKRAIEGGAGPDDVSPDRAAG